MRARADRATPDDSDGARNALLTEPYDGAAAAPAGVESAMNLILLVVIILVLFGGFGGYYGYRGGYYGRGLRRHRTRPIDSGPGALVRRWPHLVSELKLSVTRLGRGRGR